MSGTPSNEDLARQLAVLEERMNTKQAEYKTDIALLDSRMSRISEEMAKRDLRLLLTIAGLIVTMGGLATAILGFLIRLPA